MGIDMLKPCALLLLVFLSWPAFIGAAPAYRTVAPDDAIISDEQARRMLANLYLWTGDFVSARDLFLTLTRKHPDDPDLWLGLYRAAAGLKDEEQALSVLRRLSELRADDPEILLEMAWAEARLGHPRSSIGLYEQALALDPDSEKINQALAGSMVLWGDYYRAESLLKKRLAARPGDQASLLQLARLYLISGRFYEAEEYFSRARQEGAPTLDVNLGMAELMFEENRPEECRLYCRTALAVETDSPEGLSLLGKALLRLGEPREALDAYGRLAGIQGYEALGAAGQARALALMGDNDEAGEKFREARTIGSQIPEVWIASLGGDVDAALDLVHRLAGNPGLSASRLSAWGEAFNERGFNAAALVCFDAALNRDSDNYNAMLGKAHALAYSEEYDAALEAFDSLDRDYPAVAKIMTARARTLAWDRRYDEAVEAFEEISRLQPADPVPVFEGARTAAWGKQLDKAWETYSSIWRIPVDKRLALFLQPLDSEGATPEFKKALNLAVEQGKGDRIFRGYEDFSEQLKKLSDQAPPELEAACQNAVNRLRTVYRLQKAAYLEAEAKMLTRDKRFIPARQRYEELTALQPWNQEASFDLAQVECALGLCDREPLEYQRLLKIDPRHTLAGPALQRQKIRSHPALGTSYNFWREKGRGNAAGMTIERADLGIDLPIPYFCRFHIKGQGHYWWETPRRFGKQARAKGFSIQGSGPVSGYLTLAAGWTWKDYEQSRLGNKETGFAEAWVNIRDYARIGGGWRRENITPNYFAREKGIQADTVWGGVESTIVRRLEAGFKYRFLVYKDDNHEDRQTFYAGYAFTDHPRILRLLVNVERRDAYKELREIYVEGMLADMVHPYWTPREWWGGDVLLEWRHDLSRYFFCGAEQHYYDLKAGAGTDNKNNPGWIVEAEWKLEFLNHFTVGLQGRLERSREWEGTGAWVNLGYRF